MLIGLAEPRELIAEPPHGRALADDAVRVRLAERRRAGKRGAGERRDPPRASRAVEEELPLEEERVAGGHGAAILPGTKLLPIGAAVRYGPSLQYALPVRGRGFYTQGVPIHYLSWCLRLRLSITQAPISYCNQRESTPDLLFGVDNEIQPVIISAQSSDGDRRARSGVQWK